MNIEEDSFKLKKQNSWKLKDSKQPEIEDEEKLRDELSSTGQQKSKDIEEL